MCYGEADRGFHVQGTAEVGIVVSLRLMASCFTHLNEEGGSGLFDIILFLFNQVFFDGEQNQQLLEKNGKPIKAKLCTARLYIA